jgi:DNA polymerase III delta prime subunit
MQHVLWIGGPPGSGKTTIATRLARRHGLRWYNADARTWAHRDRALGEGNEAAHRWETWRYTMDPTVAPAELFAMSLHRERGPMIVDDLRAMPSSPLVVAEGTPVSPSLGAEPGRSVWLIPTPAEQEARLKERDGQAIELYRLLAGEIEREVREHHAPFLEIDGTRGIDETVTAVEELFAEALAQGPRAETPEERRALLREGNLAQVEQVRAFYARPWANGEADEVERLFICECGDTACTADATLTVAAVAAAPALSPGHEPVR